MKVGIVGAGLVGSTAAFALMFRGSCSELLLIDQDQDRAQAEADDLSHAVPFAHSARVTSGTYDQLAGAQVVVLAAGVNQSPGESRLDLLTRNAEIFREVVPQVRRAAPQAVLVVATNPVDLLTSLTSRLAPEQAVIGSGTLLDSARFRSLLADRLGVDVQSVSADVLGEHGDSEVLAWSSVRVGGLPLGEALTGRRGRLDADFRADIDSGVRKAAEQIIAGKQATNYGVGAALAEVVEAVLLDRRRVLTVSAAGPDGVAYSLPRVIGRAGVLDTFTPALSADEQAALESSVETLRGAMTQL